MQKVHDALDYDRKEQTLIAETRYSQFTDEQKVLYDNVVSAVEKFSARSEYERDAVPGQSVFFAQASAGKGKTFTMNGIIAKVRSRGQIALAVASSGLAAQLLADGRTAHSTFQIPIKIKADSRYWFSMREDATAELMRRTSLIVWDEAPMQTVG